MSKRRRPARAAARVAERTRENALRRGEAIQQGTAQPKRVRHRTAVEFLRGRNAISPAQADAAARFEKDFRASGSVIGHLVAAYAPRHRGRERWTEAPDTPEVIRRRENVERALAAVGPLSEVLISVVVFDEAPPQWARTNGLTDSDGVPAIRLALAALVSHYGGHGRSAPYRLAPPKVPAHVMTPSAAGDPAPRRGSSFRAFLDAQAQGELVGDDLLRGALSFAAERGLLDGSGGDAELRQTARRLETLARTRWVAGAA